MDSDDELMMMQLDQDDADAEADKEELLLIIGCLLRRRVRRRLPRRGDSRPGKRANKDRNRLASALMLAPTTSWSILCMGRKSFDVDLG